MKSYYFYPGVIFVALHLLSSNVNASSPLRSGKFKTSYNPGDIQSQSSPELDGKHHPCYRTCIADEPMTCNYHFNVEWYQSMSKACFECPFNVADCERRDCVVANGVSRQITVINRKIPGPSIEVCHNDKVIINVTNELVAAGSTIHWHGMHQVDTPFMDGVPFVTQCPITPESTFVYEFSAARAGTHFWHSHIGLQRGDGVTGAFIVRKPMKYEFFRNMYDYDESDHVIQIQDWSERPAQSEYTAHYHSAGSMTPSSILINGRGRFVVNAEGKTRTTKASRFNVVKGKRYRFRLINAEFSYCPVELTIDDHEFYIIATDGSYVNRVRAKSLVSFAGERFDFIVHANQDIDNYWIRIRGLNNCENTTSLRQVAVLHYEGADDDEPSGADDWKPRIYDTSLINAENQGEEQDVTTTISKLKYPIILQRDLPKDKALQENADVTFFVAYDLYIKDNEHFNKAQFYGHKQVTKHNKYYSVPTPQLNHISMKMPSSPLLVTRPPNSLFCNSSTISKSCKETFCQCYHVLSVKLNSVVEVIIIDEGGYTQANHPFHLHGHSFRVVGLKRLGENTTVEKVKELYEENKLIRNLVDPPIKDTVTVPDGGYTIIRFQATNPGYWLFHCHIEFHAEVGMALVFKVGEHSDMKPVPRDFPQCGDYKSNGGNNGLFGPQNLNSFYAHVSQQFSAYHSVIDMPMDGGQMEIIYKAPPSGM